MAKLKSKLGDRNVKVTYPVVGEVEHDNNGIIEVPDDLVSELLKVRGDELGHVEDVDARETVSKSKGGNKANTSKATKKQTTTEEEPKITEEEVRAELLKAMNENSLEALQVQCEDLDLPEEEWKELDKPGIVAYLIKQTEQVK